MRSLVSLLPISLLLAGSACDEGQPSNDPRSIAGLETECQAKVLRVVQRSGPLATRDWSISEGDGYKHSVEWVCVPHGGLKQVCIRVFESLQGNQPDRMEQSRIERKSRLLAEKDEGRAAVERQTVDPIWSSEACTVHLSGLFEVSSYSVRVDEYDGDLAEPAQRLELAIETVREIEKRRDYGPTLTAARNVADKRAAELNVQVAAALGSFREKLSTALTKE